VDARGVFNDARAVQSHREGLDCAGAQPNATKRTVALEGIPRLRIVLRRNDSNVTRPSGLVGYEEGGDSFGGEDDA
jgi:hypothetical protein